MMTRTDIEDEIRAELAVRAGDDVHTEQLLARATARGRAMRNRHRAFAAVGIATAVTVAIGIGSGVPALERPSSPATAAPSLSPSPSPRRSPPEPDEPVPANRAQVPLLPPVSGVPTAAEQPDVVGSDPSLVHLQVGEIPAPPGGMVSASWSSMPGVERVMTLGADIYLARDEAKLPVPPPPGKDVEFKASEQPVSVNGRPGRLMSRVYPDRASERWLRWQPASGVWAQVMTGRSKPEFLVAVAEAVAVDRVSRCAAPLKLRQVPNGARYLACDRAVGRKAHGEQGARLTIGDGRGKQLVASLATYPIGGGLATPKPNTKVAGKPAFWAPRIGSLAVFLPDNVLLVVEVSGGYGRREAVQVAERAVVVPSRDPTDWPADPIG